MSITSIIQQFKWRFSFTLFLVLAEAGLAILFPLVIGHAINGALAGTYEGALYLGGLGVLSLLIGAARRFFDSRFYARVFKKLGLEVSTNVKVSPSKKTARLNMLREVIEFLENSTPEIIGSIIGLAGTLIIVASLNAKIFFGCLVILVVVIIVYALTKNKTIRFNAAFNNETERQVDVVSKNEIPDLKNHLHNLMKWNIKLSDLETINFAVVWMAMMGFLVLSIIWAVGDGTTNYGKVFSLVMYVFQYIESVVTLPFFYQQWLRLKEISSRLSQMDD